MSRTLDIRPEAEADIEEGFRHYHDFSATLGSDFIDELDAVLSYIRENPAHYQSVHRDLRRALLKRFPFAVFYTFQIMLSLSSQSFTKRAIPSAGGAHDVLEIGKGRTVEAR